MKYRNEIVFYQNGGFLEFMDGEKKQYCITTEKDIDEIDKYLINNGINADGISNKSGGYYLKIRNKFRDKTLALGIIECK